MKKFTEKEYQKIVDCFDRLNNDYNMGFLNNNLVMNMQDELFNGFDFINDWPEIVSIANPLTREWAHDQYVEKEKKYFWKSKKTNELGRPKVLTKGKIGYPTDSFVEFNLADPFTESELREWGYNPDCFWKEEVE
ncbi:hypothetical protein [Fructobacillus cardui]|uniref:hypothetical protein n=1 Tax=Fructobacillus cardui TaxID=2893170 RepID=UPI002D9136CE|nr:hypothetical protein R53653_IHELHDKM_01040 [Fructobacillus cardui]